MVSQQLIGEFANVARRLGLDAASLMAVAELETALRAHAMVDGRPEPLIRFEGHYFDRRLSPQQQEMARAAGLSAPQAGAVANPASQAARWRLLERATAIDRKAAYESTSWGLGQVMGAHWAWLGYASVDALVAEARDGIAGQVRLMAAYIDKAGLVDALRRHDWAGFARGYNGPGFQRNAYDTRLAAAYRRYAGTGSGSTPDGELRTGARGEAVRELQNALVGLGFAIAADGIFGPMTEEAVRAFQRQDRMASTGIACATTLARIAGARQGVARSTGIGSLLHQLLAVVGVGGMFGHGRY